METILFGFIFTFVILLFTLAPIMKMCKYVLLPILTVIGGMAVIVALLFGGEGSEDKNG